MLGCVPLESTQGNISELQTVDQPYAYARTERNRPPASAVPIPPSYSAVDHKLALGIDMLTLDEPLDQRATSSSV
jgi:hypothetical protein